MLKPLSEVIAEGKRKAVKEDLPIISSEIAKLYKSEWLEYDSSDSGWKKGIASSKPDECKLCPNFYSGYGFLSDLPYTSKHKILLIVNKPHSFDIAMNAPTFEDIEENRGNWLKWLMNYVPITRDEILVSHVTRCASKTQYKLNTRQKDLCKAHCRRHDNEIKRYDPNVFIPTFGPDKIFKQQAYFRLVIADIEKALKFRDKYGLRPCVLMGESAVQLLWDIPFKIGKGGLKAWRGHYWYGNWPY